MRVVTDYNDAIRAPVTPDIVTMNNAHPTHYSEAVEPGVKYVLRGWDPAGGVASHHLEYRDIRIRNVPTNVRELGGTRYNGNSIFVFEVAGLCIAHLGHLHHTLTQTHLAELGAIDVVMVPVDGTYTLNQEEMVEVLRQIGPKLVIPMHIFTQASLEKFLARASGFYAVRRDSGPAVVLSRAGLPSDTGNPRAGRPLGRDAVGDASARASDRAFKANAGRRRGAFHCPGFGCRVRCNHRRFRRQTHFSSGDRLPRSEK